MCAALEGSGMEEAHGQPGQWPTWSWNAASHDKSPTVTTHRDSGPVPSTRTASSPFLGIPRAPRVHDNLNPARLEPQTPRPS